MKGIVAVPLSLCSKWRAAITWDVLHQLTPHGDTRCCEKKGTIGLNMCYPKAAKLLQKKGVLDLALHNHWGEIAAAAAAAAAAATRPFAA